MLQKQFQSETNDNSNDKMKMQDNVHNMNDKRFRYNKREVGYLTSWIIRVVW